MVPDDVDRWDEFSWWWYTIMPVAMVPFWIAFVWVVIARIHADRNGPPPCRADSPTSSDSKGD